MNDEEKRGLSIIFHSGSFDRVYHGLSIALAALALGRGVKFFFTYWALEYLRRKKVASPLELGEEARGYKKILLKSIKKGHVQKIAELFTQAKAMGAKFYACTSSMGLLNLSRGELIDAVDKSMGITTFLTESKADQILFI